MYESEGEYVELKKLTIATLMNMKGFAARLSEVGDRTREACKVAESAEPQKKFWSGFIAN